MCRHKNILYLVEAFQDDSWMYVVVARCYGDFFSRYNVKLGLAPREIAC